MFNKFGIVQDRLGAMMKFKAWRITTNLLMDSGAENDISMEIKVLKGENCIKIDMGADDYSVKEKDIKNYSSGLQVSFSKITA